MTTIDLTVEIASYIAHPYWPAREKLINIIKESGASRARSSANKRKALEEYLSANGMVLAEYDALEKEADKQFYTDDSGRVILPKRSVDGMLVAVCDTARAAFKPCPPEQVRTALTCTPWVTNVTEADAQWWERYAVVSSGTGAKLSNQRALRRNAYVGANPPADVPAGKPVEATGTIAVNPDMVRPEVLQKALEWGGRTIGIGASRKMGWGRFTLVGFDVQ